MPILLMVMCWRCGTKGELQASIDKPNLSFLVPWTPDAPAAWGQRRDDGTPQANAHAFFRYRKTHHAVCGVCGQKDWLEQQAKPDRASDPVAT